MNEFIERVYKEDRPVQQVLPNFRSNLNLRFDVNQREKSTLTQDFSTLLNKEKGYLRSLGGALSGLGLSKEIEKRGVAMEVIKQLFLKGKGQKLKYLRS